MGARGVYTLLASLCMSQNSLVFAHAFIQILVQLNIILGAFSFRGSEIPRRNAYVCTSATGKNRSFSDILSGSGRLRNSRFDAAFVDTLRKMVDEDHQPIWTVEKQRKYIHNATASAELPTEFKSVPRVPTDSPESRLIYHIFFLDYRVTFDQPRNLPAEFSLHRILPAKSPPNRVRRICQQPLHWAWLQLGRLLNMRCI